MAELHGVNVLKYFCTGRTVRQTQNVRALLYVVTVEQAILEAVVLDFQAQRARCGGSAVATKSGEHVREVRVASVSGTNLVKCVVREADAGGQQRGGRCGRCWGRSGGCG